jgi:CBS domain containing-hemolysin-like protein
MEDILEETLGRFRRKDRSHAMLERVAPGRWRVSGPCTIDDFRTEYPALADQSDVDTMGGLLVRQMDYEPTAGESTTFQGLKLTARRVDERRVLEMDVEALKR